MGEWNWESDAFGQDTYNNNVNNMVKITKDFAKLVKVIEIYFKPYYHIKIYYKYGRANFVCRGSENYLLSQKIYKLWE